MVNQMDNPRDNANGILLLSVWGFGLEGLGVQRCRVSSLGNSGLQRILKLIGDLGSSRSHQLSLQFF